MKKRKKLFKFFSCLGRSTEEREEETSTGSALCQSAPIPDQDSSTIFYDRIRYTSNGSVIITWPSRMVIKSLLNS